MNARIQIVARLPVELNRRVRAAAKRRKVSVNTFLIEALSRAVAGPARALEQIRRPVRGDSLPAKH